MPNKKILQILTTFAVAVTLSLFVVATVTAKEDLPPRAGDYPGTVEKLDWPKDRTKPTDKKPADEKDTEPSDTEPVDKEPKKP